MLLPLLFLSCVTSPEPIAPPRVVEVVRGDTLGRIAKREGVTVRDLMSWNELSDDRIDVGQRLIVSGSGAGPVAVSPPRPRGASSGRPRASTVEAPLDLDGPQVPRLLRPKPKPCLGGPDPASVDGDFGMATSQGLTEQGTSATMNAFLPKVSSCLVAMDPSPTTSLDLEIQVACSGVVTSVTVHGSNDWPQPNVACLTKALRFASFPSHARPDGDSFLFPLSLQ